MDVRRFPIHLPFVFLVTVWLAPTGYCAAGASPEPGDQPIVEKIQVTQEETTPTISEALPPEKPEFTPSTTTSMVAPSEKRIPQRVENVSTDEVIRVAPKPRKNVFRIDNKPNRPRATPIAVIKGPVAPWGYAGRYMSGQVVRPSAKDMQGTGARPGQPGERAGAALQTGGLSGGSRRSGQGSRRSRE